MNEEKLVTVIVPLHNGERYLKKCLDSIRKQSYSELEIIVVDDCSTDNSLSVVSRIAEIDHRIRIVRLKGRDGAQSARYAGIDEAKGSKIMFVDSDDMLRPKAVESLVRAMDTLDVDLVQMRFLRRVGRINVRYGETYDPNLSNRRIEGKEFQSLTSYIGMDSFLSPSVWGKLYRSSLMRIIQRTPFDQFWGDDQICNIDYLRLARSIAFIDYTGYIYRWGGRTTRFTFSDLEKYKNVYKLKLKLGQNEIFLHQEMQLLLRYYIRQLNTELGWTRDAVIMILRKELEDPLWHGVVDTEDIESMVDYEFTHLQQNAFKTIVKRLLR